MTETVAIETLPSVPLSALTEAEPGNIDAEKVKKVPINEEHILTLMEMMAFSRVEAIGILNEYHNDLNAILQSLLP